ncbi:TPA: filamentous hemagglutinin N-terminal domain-containing protein [Campylobacter lari]|nr:filamentous hemagglutinin N-terminal domain-containing protein [Campylobacter lari]
MKKLANHIILSGVTVSMLFSPLMALPSGGKFTHGTSGSITSNGNNMNIIGNGTNSVIQWGGGFNIGKGESVNFGGNSKNYLNIAHGTSKSMIEGLLNANGKNVFLINPNGVIITKTGTINANRFVASTSSMSDGDMWKFADMKTLEQGLSFSPIFKPHKAGNVVNMGNINANNVLLIGNKVSIDGGHINGKHNDNVSGDALKNPSGNTADKVHLVGNEVNILVDGIKSNSIIASAYSKGALQQSTTSYYNYGNSLGKLNFITQEYNNIDKTNLGNKKLVTKDKFEKHATIGSDIDWFYFAKGWNENKNDMRDFFGTYKLVDDIDFGGNKGKNYANYCIASGQCTSMIIGSLENNAFSKIFDGQGFTLKNINMDIKTKTEQFQGIGIFGSARGATFKNINVDYMGGGIKYESHGATNSNSVGGFIGFAYDSNFNQISIVNINEILNLSYNDQDGASIHTGGFAGDISRGEISNIYLNNINHIGGFISGEVVAGSMSGGFVGRSTGIFSNISLNNIGKISSEVKGKYYISNSAGGFIGRVDGTGFFNNISLYNIEEIDSIDHGELYNSVGGFIGDGSYCSGDCGFTNISLESIKNIGNSKNTRWAGGFIGNVSEHSVYNIENIYLYFDKGVNINAVESTGKFLGRNMSLASLNFKNIHIYHHENDLSNAIADQSYWGNTNYKINIHTYNNSTQSDAYKDFLSKANTIEKPSKPTNPTDPTDPSNPDVILDSDDVISAEDLNKWLDEIFGGDYWVDIKDLGKIQGLSESIAQSISFLEALYSQKGMKEILEKFHDDYKTAYSKYDKFKTDKANLLAFINDKLKPLVKSSNDALTQLKLIQEQLKIAIAKYNDYVKKINENPAIKNEETLNALKAEVDRLNQLSGELATTIANNQIQLEAWQDKASTDSNEHFTIKGQFDNVALLIPDLEKVTANGNENDDYEKISRQVANLQKQTPVFEYEDEETEEVDETSLAQKNKTCIVSDNYKTMNPCVAGM